MEASALTQQGCPRSCIRRRERWRRRPWPADRTRTRKNPRRRMGRETRSQQQPL